MSLLHARFELVMPHCLRMILSDPDVGILDIDEYDPHSDGAYAPFLGSVDLHSTSKTTLKIECDFPFEAGRKSAAKSRIKAVIDAAVKAAEL